MSSRSELRSAPWWTSGALLVPACFLSLGGCLSDPEGRAARWPLESTTVEIAAITAGDVDGDGVTDVVAIVAGKEPDGAGLYLFRGSADIRPQQAGGLVKSFTSVASLGDVSQPANLAVVDIDPSTPEKDVAVLMPSPDGLQLSFFRGAGLSPSSAVPIPGARPSGRPEEMWIRSVPFGPGGHFLMFRTGPEVRHVKLNEVRSGATPRVDKLPPPPGKPDWGDPQLVDGASDGSNQVLLATGDSVFAAVLSGGPIDWTPRRTGAPWGAQTSGDLNGDGVPEVVGLGGSALCVQDPLIARTGTCLDAPLEGNPGSAHPLIGELTGDAEPDVLLISMGGQTPLSLLPSVKLDGSTGNVSSGAPLSTMLPFPDGMVVIGRFEPGLRRDQIIAFGHRGESDCVHASQGQLVKCHAGGP